MSLRLYVVEAAGQERSRHILTGSAIDFNPAFEHQNREIRAHSSGTTPLFRRRLAPPAYLMWVRAYCQLWATLSLMELIRGNMASGQIAMRAVQAILLCATSLHPALSLIVCTFAARLAWTASRLLYTFDSEMFCAITDLPVLLLLLVGDDGQWIGRTLRRQTGLFYLCAGLWKVNTAFLDHRYSCSTVYLAQILDAYWLGDSPLARPFLHASPLLTIGLEISTLRPSALHSRP